MLLALVFACHSDGDGESAGADSAPLDDSGPVDTGSGPVEPPAWADLTLQGGIIAEAIGNHGAVASTWGTVDEAHTFQGSSWVIQDVNVGTASDDAVAIGSVNLWDVVGDMDGDSISEWVGGDLSETLLFAGDASTTSELSSEHALMSVARMYATGGEDLTGNGSRDLVAFSVSIEVFDGARGGTAKVPDVTVEFVAGVLPTAVAGVGDVTGDGVADLVFNAFGEVPENVRLLAGPLEGAIPYDGSVPLGEPVADQFTFQTAPAGDIDGDGLGDVLVHQMADGGRRTILAAYTNGGKDAASVEIEESAGTVLRCSGDLDGDGYSDVAVGVSLDEGVSHEAWVVLGPMTGVELVHGQSQFPVSDPYWGLGGVTVGDLNDDGQDDLMVGAQRGSTKADGRNQGDVFVKLGPI